jgi:pyruvate-formate lyase-activating enzyme
MFLPSARFWIAPNACSLRCLNCCSMASRRARYSSRSKAAGRAARSSWISAFIAAARPKPRPGGNCKRRGCCGSPKLLT